MESLRRTLEQHFSSISSKKKKRRKELLRKKKLLVAGIADVFTVFNENQAVRPQRWTLT